MTKFWIVFSEKNSGVFERHKSYEAAEISAKRHAFENRSSEFIILEAVASTQQPVPAIDVVKLV